MANTKEYWALLHSKVSIYWDGIEGHSGLVHPTIKDQETNTTINIDPSSLVFHVEADKALSQDHDDIYEIVDNTDNKSTQVSVSYSDTTSEALDLNIKIVATGLSWANPWVVQDGTRYFRSTEDNGDIHIPLVGYIISYIEAENGAYVYDETSQEYIIPSSYTPGVTRYTRILPSIKSTRRTVNFLPEESSEPRNATGTGTTATFALKIGNDLIEQYEFQGNNSEVYIDLPINLTSTEMSTPDFSRQASATFYTPHISGTGLVNIDSQLRGIALQGNSAKTVYFDTYINEFYIPDEVSRAGNVGSTFTLEDLSTDENSAICNPHNTGTYTVAVDPIQQGEDTPIVYADGVFTRVASTNTSCYITITATGLPNYFTDEATARGPSAGTATTIEKVCTLTCNLYYNSMEFIVDLLPTTEVDLYSTPSGISWNLFSINLLPTVANMTNYYFTYSITDESGNPSNIATIQGADSSGELKSLQNSCTVLAETGSAGRVKLHVVATPYISFNPPDDITDDTTVEPIVSDLILNIHNENL